LENASNTANVGWLNEAMSAPVLRYLIRVKLKSNIFSVIFTKQITFLTNILKRRKKPNGLLSASLFAFYCVYKKAFGSLPRKMQN
jgi:hypothetical protein